MPYNIVLDFETTGVNPLKDLPVQAACAVYDYNGEELEYWVPLIYPKIAIDPGAEKVHGISEEVLKIKGISLTEFSEKWHKFVWKYRPANILGYNIINCSQIIRHTISPFH